jgi:hypothetical protein
MVQRWSVMRRPLAVQRLVMVSRMGGLVSSSVAVLATGALFCHPFRGGARA